MATKSQWEPIAQETIYRKKTPKGGGWVVAALVVVGLIVLGNSGSDRVNRTKVRKVS
jgi:hypothetical protein